MTSPATPNLERAFAGVADNYRGADVDLNAIYRDKEIATDILSFPISNDEGEIYICPSETRKEAKKFDRTYENFFAYLFIHGCTHLKGHDHSAIMESIEVEVRRKFKV